ncbi:MAG TPA: C4-type zinc ribbon domain-containing protein [Thermoanaerobaculia bacterium]|nr:C4-type zinc ribbon domain-containing protein [Thermoanaerobaculia bacterium]
MSGDSPLDQLYRLQDRLRFVAAKEKERETVPPELTEVDRAYREMVGTVEALKHRLVEARAELRKAEGELGDIREKQKKYQTQLRSVQTSREYGAVLNEIDGVEKLLRSTEDTVLALEEEIESTEKDLAGREERLPRETEEHEEKLKDWRVVQRSIDEELTAARGEIRELEAKIPARERTEFRRLLEKKGGLAIVPVVSNSCSACHVKVRPAAIQVLRAGREVVYCDSCKRILYYDPQAS